MADFQYKTASSGSWLDVPTRAYHGTLEGSLDIVYPEAADRDGAGRVCGAVGVKDWRMRSARLTASGMQFWQGQFSATSSLDVEFWLTGRDARDNTWHQYTGWLERPTYGRVQIGTGSLSTLYENVEITMTNLTAV